MVQASLRAVGALVFSGSLMLGLAHCSGDAAPLPPPASPTSETPSAPPVIVAPIDGLIGPEGGTLVHSSGARLMVPEGALAIPTRLTLTGVAAPSSDVLGGAPLGQGIEAGPDGQTFLKPVEIVLPFDPTRLPKGADAANAQVRMAPQQTTDFVALDSSVDLPSRSIHAKTLHFTQFVPADNPNPVFITTASDLGQATMGAAFSRQINATGGAAPYTWSLASGSALPPALTLGTNGSLAGTPAIPSVFGFILKASDSAGYVVQKAFSLTVLASANPLPSLASVSPTTIPQGSATTTITLAGTGFAPNSQALWDGTPIPTAFVSSTGLAAAVDASRLVDAGTHAVSVSSPAPGGGISNTVTFTVSAVPQNPIPTIASVSPTLLPVSSTDTQIDIVGTSFSALTSATIGTQGISTSYVSPTTLRATIPASFLATPASLAIGVYNPPPGGGFSTSTVTVTVGTLNPVPVLGSISPSSVTAGSAAFTMTLSGSGFASGGTVFFNATALTTAVSNSTTATVTVPASLVTTSGTATITFVNATPGGGASAGSTFTITSASSGDAAADEGITCTGSYAGTPRIETHVKVRLYINEMNGPDFLDLESVLVHGYLFCGGPSTRCATLSTSQVTAPSSTFTNSLGGVTPFGTGTLSGIFLEPTGGGYFPTPSTQVTVSLSFSRSAANVTCSGTALRADVL